MLQLNDVIDLPSSLSEKSRSKAAATASKRNSATSPATIPAAPVSPNTRATKARQALFGRFAAQLKRVMWRAGDVQAELDAVAESLDIGLVSGPDIDAATASLAAAQPPAQIRVTVGCLDGTLHAVRVQPAYIAALDVNKFGAGFDPADHCVIGAASVGDLKLQIQATTGVPAVAQILYFYDGTTSAAAADDTATGTADATDAASATGAAPAAPADKGDDLDDCDALDDDEPIAALQARGLADGSRLHLVVDADRHYWQLHRSLAATFRKPLLSGYQAMLSLMPAASARTHSRAVKFCRTCRRALAFLGETRAGGHKARGLEVVEKVERHLVDTILPILRAVAARLRQIDDGHRAMDEGDDGEGGAGVGEHGVLFGDD